MSKVIIIGGGAAGLMAAYASANNGQDVTVLERNERPARKVMITGKGRCNVTNDTDVNGLVNAVTEKNSARFLYSAFNSFSSADGSYAETVFVTSSAFIGITILADSIENARRKLNTFFIIIIQSP